MAQKNDALTQAQNPEVTQTDRELMVDLLMKFQDVAKIMVKSKYCTKTDAQMLRKVYGNIQIRVSQNTAF